MLDNVPQQYIPDNLPELIFPLPEFDWAYNTKRLNTTQYILHDRVDEQGWADETALSFVDDNRSFSYSEVVDTVDRLANGCRSIGIEFGDRVLYRMNSRPEAVFTILALWKLGAVVVPATLAHQAEDIRYFLKDTNATAVVSSTQDVQTVYDALEGTNGVDLVVVNQADNETSLSDARTNCHYYQDLVSRDADTTPPETAPLDVAAICYTSGTTGKPKGCVWTHASQVAGGIIVSDDMGLDSSSVYFTHAPIGHGGGFFHKSILMYNGPTIVLSKRPKPERVVDIINTHDVTHTLIVPTMWRMILELDEVSSEDFEGLDFAWSSVERLTRETYDRASELVGAEIANAVGMNPIGGVSPFIRSFEEGRKVAPDHAVGKPAPGFEAKVVDESGNELEDDNRGQLAIRGPTGIIYWQNAHPEIAERQQSDVIDGWSITDDVYRKDGAWLWFEGRIDDMISSAGHLIAGPEVEEALLEHESVSEVAVIGVPDKMRGEIVKAYIVTHEDVNETGDLQTELQEFVKDRITKYKYPREIEFLEELPRNKMGKVSRAALEELHEDSSQSDATVGS